MNLKYFRILLQNSFTMYACLSNTFAAVLS